MHHLSQITQVQVSTSVGQPHKLLKTVWSSRFYSYRPTNNNRRLALRGRRRRAARSGAATVFVDELPSLAGKGVDHAGGAGTHDIGDTISKALTDVRETRLSRHAVSNQFC